MPRYRVEQQEVSERWLITHAADSSLIWAGSHWSFYDQSGSALISFADYDAAQNYARTILGDEQ